MLWAPSEHVEESMYPRFENRGIIAPPHPLFSLTDISDDLCEKLSSLFPMTVCTLQSFEEKLLAVARNDTAQQSVTTEDLQIDSEP
ncbi:hypothetical protein DV704_08270 [Meiothermus sp. QL-1]|nr:hypothetical protein DV704_08270 [Meiothermus sp. QL-1]